MKKGIAAIAALVGLSIAGGDALANSPCYTWGSSTYAKASDSDSGHAVLVKIRSANGVIKSTRGPYVSAGAISSYYASSGWAIIWRGCNSGPPAG
jgi:hypothetical protein